MLIDQVWRVNTTATEGEESKQTVGELPWCCEEQSWHSHRVWGEPQLWDRGHQQQHPAPQQWTEISGPTEELITPQVGTFRNIWLHKPKLFQFPSRDPDYRVDQRGECYYSWSRLLKLSILQIRCIFTKIINSSNKTKYNHYFLCFSDSSQRENKEDDLSPALL